MYWPAMSGTFDGSFSAGCVVGCSTTGFDRSDMVFNRHSNNDGVVYTLWILRKSFDKGK